MTGIKKSRNISSRQVRDLAAQLGILDFLVLKTEGEGDTEKI